MGTIYLGTRRATFGSASRVMTAVFRGTFGCLARNLDLSFTATVLDFSWGRKPQEKRSASLLF